MAHTARTDPTPTTPHGEALAHLQGRTTYSRDWQGRLEPRDHWQIAGTGGHWRYDIVADHQCHVVPLPAAPSVFQEKSHHDRPINPPY